MRRGPSAHAVLWIASLGAAVAFVDVTIVNIAFPDIARSFEGTSTSSLSWVLNAYNIVFAAFLVAAGRIADLLGRRRVFIFGLELFVAASLLCAVAWSVDALIAFRVVQALGAALVVPSSLALVLNAFPPERRSHGVALLSAVGAAAAGLGPSLGGLLVAAGNWRLVFLVNLPIGVAAVLLARRRLVESRTPGRRRMPDLLGALVFAIAIAALVLGIVQGPEWGWGSVRIVASFAVAGALGAFFLWRCSWHRAPVIDLTLLRNRTFGVANAMTVVGAAGFYGYTLANVLFLTGVWRYSVLEAGLAMTIGPVVAVAVAGPTSRLVQRIGHRAVLVAGGLLWGGAVMWFVARVGSTPDFVGEWLPGMALLGIGAGTLFPNLSGAAVASAPGDGFATATGMNSVARQVGGALGVALVIAIIGAPERLQALAAFQDAWVFAAVCLFVAGLGSLLVGRVDPQLAPPLREAARVVFEETGPAATSTPVRPSARRMMSVDTAGPATPRAESSADFLARVPLFSELAPELRTQLAARSRETRLEAGEWLFREGDAADAVYIVRAGRLEVVDEAGPTLLRELGRGDALGELALLTTSTRSASVRAGRATELIVIERNDFEELLDTSRALSTALARSLALQLREAGAPARAARPRPTTVAIVALDERVPVARLTAQLAGALKRYLAVGVLVGREVASPPVGAEPSTVYGPTLDRAETSHDLVLLAGGSAWHGDPWTEFCLQQADRVLAVTSGAPLPDGVAVRAELRGCDLVVAGADPGAAGEWAAALDPVESHAVRATALEGDVARMARRLSGRSLGIVLSGGGARAFAHIGVLEELSAAGVIIDRVAGVSMGAMIGALFAMGMDGDEMDARCFEEWVQRRPLGDYAFSRHGLIRGDRMRSMLHRTYGATLIEELPRSFMSGATELRSGRLVLARHGPLWEAVGLSMCLPLFVPPEIRGDDLLIDGSLTDNLPVEAMAHMGEGPIIAVDVKASFERAPSDGARRRGRDGRATQAPPSLGETLTRVLLLGSENTSEAARRHADLVIKPAAVGIGLLEFHQLDAAREAGRAATREVLGNAPAGLFG